MKLLRVRSAGGEVFDDSVVRLFQTVTAAALGARWTSLPVLACSSLFSLTSPDVAGRRCALTLPVRSMLGRKKRRLPDAVWKQLELLERSRCGLAEQSDDTPLLGVTGEDSLSVTDRP